MNISPASQVTPAYSMRVAGGLRRRTSRLLFRLAAKLQDAATALDGETIDVPTADDPPRPWLAEGSLASGDRRHE